MSSRHISMRDIAQMAGTSAVTVSKALAGKPGMSDALRQKILAIAARTGYVLPGQKAQDTPSPLNIGILLPERYFGPQAYYSMMCRQLLKNLADLGHFGTMQLLSSEDEKALLPPHLVRQGQVDGMILLGQPSKAYYRRIAQEACPVVCVDFYDEQGNADSVVGDNAYGTYRLTSHLIRNGHTEIGFVGSIKMTSSIMDRFLGYSRAMIMHDLAMQQEWIIDDRDANGNLIPLQLPELLPTAFVCNCDMVAQRLITQLQEKGYRVPEDISVTGFDDFLIGPQTKPAITTFRLRTEDMINLAIKTIIDRCRGKEGPFSRTVVSGQPIYRESERAIQDQ